MLRALRAELAYFWPWLLGGLGIATGVVIIISVVFSVVGDEGPTGSEAAGIRAMFMVLAPMVVGFIVQGVRSEERRARLLLAGPLTARDFAGAMVLLPVVLFAIGVLAAGLVIGIESLITGRFDQESLNTVGFVGGQLFVYTQMGLLAQEAAAARSQQRLTAAVAGWAGFVVAVALVAAMYLALARQLATWDQLLLGHAIVAVLIMVVTVTLYTGRTDFTR